LLVRPKTIVFGRTYVLRMMFFSEHEISEMRGPTGLKFCTLVSTRPNFIMPSKILGGAPQKKFRGRKTCKIWANFGRLRSSAANISETDEYIQNRIFIPSTAIPPALGETSPVKFGPVTLEISMLNRTHPKRIFLKNIFRPPRGCCDPKFLHALENHQVLLAHPSSGTGTPLQLFFKGGLKIGLKCNEGALITSELGGVARRNFGTLRGSWWGC